MATLLTLRRRIKTAQNISKTTRAMQMIAASKLKRAQSAAVATRPYVNKLTTISQSLGEKDAGDYDSLIPYLQTQNSGKNLYIIISPDKGLAGGMITNLIREYFRIDRSDADFVVVGKKLEGPVASTSKNLIASFPAGSTLPTFDQVAPLIKIVDEYFLGGKVDRVSILTTHFNSVFSQKPLVTTLLPVVLPEKTPEISAPSYTLIEPHPKELLPALLTRYVQMVIYQSLLESYASFQAAQMIAMQNATDNAKDIVNDLTLVYNKARQERITKEILDISGAAAVLAQE